MCFLISRDKDICVLNEWSTFVADWCGWPILAVARQLLMDNFFLFHQSLAVLATPCVLLSAPFLPINPKDNRSKLTCNSIESS